MPSSDINGDQKIVYEWRSGSELEMLRILNVGMSMLTNGNSDGFCE